MKKLLVLAIALGVVGYALAAESSEEVVSPVWTNTREIFEKLNPIDWGKIEARNNRVSEITRLVNRMNVTPAEKADFLVAIVLDSIARGASAANKQDALGRSLAIIALRDAFSLNTDSKNRVRELLLNIDVMTVEAEPSFFEKSRKSASGAGLSVAPVAPASGAGPSVAPVAARVLSASEQTRIANLKKQLAETIPSGKAAIQAKIDKILAGK